MNLLDQLSEYKNDPQNVRAVVATVSLVTAPTVSLSIAGATVTNVPKVTAYTPTVGDTVLVLKIGSAWLVLAQLG